MADFQHHLIYGVGMSVTCAAVGHFQFGLTPVQAGAAAILGSAASLAPDLDHPEGLPGRILFEILGVLIPIVTLPHLPWEYKQQFAVEHWILYFCLAYLVVRFFLGYLFTKLMTHRGIFHSLPAACICGQIIFLWMSQLLFMARVTIATIAVIGYVTHLVADEVYSVDWKGNSIKRSFGSALDLGHISEFSTWLAYGILISLGYIIFQQVNAMPMVDFRKF